VDLNQVTVPCRDYAASLRFYRSLGLVPIVEDPPGYARFECPDGGSTFSLHGREGGDDEVVVYFEVADLDARVAALRAGGLAFESGPEDQPWLWREATLRDPAGNLVCLYRAGEARRFPPWRVDRRTADSDARVARWALALSAAVFAAAGALFLAAPGVLALAGIGLAGATADGDVRAVYGGLELGLGIFFAGAVARPAWHRPALLAAALAFGGLAAGRLLSGLVVGPPEPLGLTLLAAEVAGLALALAALRRTR